MVLLITSDLAVGTEVDRLHLSGQAMTATFKLASLQRVPPWCYSPSGFAFRSKRFLHS